MCCWIVNFPAMRHVLTCEVSAEKPKRKKKSPPQISILPHIFRGRSPPDFTSATFMTPTPLPSPFALGVFLQSARMASQRKLPYLCSYFVYAFVRDRTCVWQRASASVSVSKSVNAFFPRTWHLLPLSRFLFLPKSLLFSHLDNRQWQWSVYRFSLWFFPLEVKQESPDSVSIVRHGLTPFVLLWIRDQYRRIVDVCYTLTSELMFNWMCVLWVGCHPMIESNTLRPSSWSIW